MPTSTNTVHITQWGIVVTLGNPGGSPLAVDCNSPADGNVGAPYIHSFLASGGTAPYSFAIVSGSLPVGLFMDSSGNVTGTAFIAGTSVFTLQVTDSTLTTAQVVCSITIIGVANLTAGSTLQNRCHERNGFDCCLERLALNWRRITFPPLCAIPREMCELYPYPWDEDTQNPHPIPKDAVPVRQAKGITTPAAAAGDQTILSYVVPQGYDALITSFWFGYSGTGFVQGSGDILFRIQQNQRYLKGLSNVPFLIGAPKFPCPMTEGQIVMSGSLLRLVVNVPNLSGLILVGSSTVSAGFQGFLWAR
jgi:Putative Ig domain